MLILSRDYMQIRTAEQEYRGRVSSQSILPEMTSCRKWPRPNIKILSRDSEQAHTADQVYRASDCSVQVSKVVTLQNCHPPATGSS